MNDGQISEDDIRKCHLEQMFDTVCELFELMSDEEILNIFYDDEHEDVKLALQRARSGYCDCDEL